MLQPYVPTKTNFINGTTLSDKEAGELLTKVRNLYLQNQAERNDYLTRAERAMNIWKGEIWSDEDLDFFRRFDITPYSFRQHRPLINSLINRQRARKYNFELVPRDIHSFKRMRDGRDVFIAQNREFFPSDEEAGKYYDNYADDEFAAAVTGMLETVRKECDAASAESECFENGIITSASFLKSVYSNEYNREGSVVVSAVPARKMIWDTNAVRYDLSDSEYIGEIFLYYKDELKALYPDLAEQIEKNFKQYTNMDGSPVQTADQSYRNFYQYNENNSLTRIMLFHLWYKTIETRFKVYDTQKNEQRIAAHGLTLEQVQDGLREVMAIDMSRELMASGRAEEILSPDYQEQVILAAEERFQITETLEPIWYKIVFTYDGLFEFERSPFPHGSHPYTPFFPQFTDGYYSGVVDDVADIILALNKAINFREMMMAHGAKGLLIVDANAVAAANLDLDDVAEAWTQVGGIIALKPKAGNNIDNSFRQITTLGQGLGEINALIQDYTYRLEYILGVNRAQMGISSSDAPAARYRMELAEGESNNGIIFDNFVRTKERHYNDKTIPLVVELMRLRPDSVVRQLGDSAKAWLDVDLGETLDVFSDAVRNGEYSLVLKPVENNPQLNASRSAQYMNLAAAGIIPIETAIEFSDDPQRMKVLKSIRENRLRNARESAATQVDMQMAQRTMLELGLSPEVVDEFMRKASLDRIKQLEAQRNQTRPQGQGMTEVQTVAAEPTRQQQIENQTLTQ